MGDLPVIDELASVFARMSGLLLSRQTVEDTLGLVTTLATETIAGSVGAGLSLLDEQGRRTTAAASDPVVEQADAAQYEMGEGPCLTAWAQRTMVRVDDISTDRRWPAWGETAHSLGLRAALSAPLVAGDAAFGAMKVYADHRGAYDPVAERRLSLFAGQAGVLVANVVTHEAARKLSERLTESLRTRDLIGRATGILMGRDHLDESTALAVLVGRSQRERRKLRDVAQDVVDVTARRRR